MDQQTLLVMQDALAAEQARVLATVSVMSGADWEMQLPVAAARELVDMGHFKQYETELGWTPRQVVGHLRDSAQIFNERIQALQGGTRPLLADFVTDAPTRLADYASHTPKELLAGLAASQQQLREVLATVVVPQLFYPGIHEVDGTLTLADVVAFLPGHQRDHAGQLARLLATAETNRNTNNRLARGQGSRRDRGASE